MVRFRTRDGAHEDLKFVEIQFAIVIPISTSEDLPGFVRFWSAPNNTMFSRAKPNSTRLATSRFSITPGTGLFSHQEDIYNPAAMGKMINAWAEAREQLQKEGGDTEEAELARSAAAFTAQRSL